MTNNRTRFMKTFQFTEEQLLSPLSAFEFCDSDLLQQTIQSSEVASTSNYCYGEWPFYTTDLPFPPKCPSSLVDNTTITTATTAATNDLSSIFEEKINEHGLSSSPLDLLTNTLVFTNNQYNQGQFDDLSLLQNQTQTPSTTNNNNTFLMDDLSSMHPASSSNFSLFVDPSVNSYLPKSSEIFGENFLLGNDMSQTDHHELEFQGNDAVNFCTNHPLPHSFNSSSERKVQALSNEDQYFINGVGSCTSQLEAEMKSLESETFRVPNKLTTEERKQKIRKYMNKRNQRNFTKKIKYACRKTLADSRPRVRGRFAKNDEFGDQNNNNRSNNNLLLQEEEEDDIMDRTYIYTDD